MATHTVKRKLSALGGLTAASVFMAGCASGEAPEVSQLTIVTTDQVLDQATALTVAEYVQEQDTHVEVQDRRDPAAVFDALEQDAPEDHAVIGIVTAHREPDADQEAELQLPANLELISQAPAELGLVPATSTMTAAQFVLDQQAAQDQAVQDGAEPEQDLEFEAACESLTWIHAETPNDRVDSMNQDLADMGCQPAFETPDVMDAAAYDEITGGLINASDTVAMLYSLDPAIADQGLTSLELEGLSWPRGKTVAVASHDIDEALAQHIAVVIEQLESEDVTDLLRGYHNARQSESDLDYEVEHAVRHWFGQHDLIDGDTVTDISTDTE